MNLPERDWKYLRSIHDELLATLCRRINQEAMEILTADAASEYKKYLALYEQMQLSDKMVADCFDDWRRSNLWLKLQLLQKHKLLGPEEIGRLSDEARELLKRSGHATGL